MVECRARGKRILAEALAGLALAALVVTLAPSMLAPWVLAGISNSGQHRAMGGRELSARAGIPVRVGWIAWNPLRGSVTFHDVRIATTADAPPIVTLAGVRIDGSRDVRRRRECVGRPRRGARTGGFALAGGGDDVLERELGAPLAVALALMKDSRGDIRLSLPIAGDLAAQEYRVENVMPTALRAALVGALRSPITLLGSAFHRDEGERFDLRPVPFPPGSVELGPPGEERIGQIAGLLTRQPGLVAVRIPEPSAADVTALRAGAATPPSVDEQLRTLADARATVVTRRLVEGHHVAPERVGATPWRPGEPVPDASPGVDVQLRGGAG
jgi:hypothetical protein